MRTILRLLICLVAPLASADDLPLPAPGGNYYEALAKSSDTYDDATKRVAAKIAKSRVPTHEQAEKIALRAFISKPGVDAREAWTATGLYVLGRDMPDFGVSGDLIWEIRVVRMAGAISGVVWVSSSTGASRILFP